MEAQPCPSIFTAFNLNPRELIPMAGGTVSSVWQVRAGDDRYLLRTLTGREQGEREWAIFCHLRERGFSALAELVPTVGGPPAVQSEGVWYQLQRYLPGERPNPAGEGTARRVARTVTALLDALSDCPAVAGEPFDLAECWTEGRENWPLLGLALPLPVADEAVAHCLTIPSRGRQVIHGDLGLWNMVDTGDSIAVIDFDAARMGDPYFDLGTVFAALVNHSPDGLRPKVCGEFLAVAAADRDRLGEQVSLWAWRGLAQCACQAGQPDAPLPPMAEKFLHGWSWTKEHLYEL